ncbi:MAG: hypothetical protein HXX14_12415 [Bacteroidetes bacterium]|nr:hypothetical protein [Bacteroidota bacterium]
MPTQQYTGEQIQPMQGFYIAIVTKISEDPESLFSVQIEIQSDTPTKNILWARMSNFYATSGAGSCFLPEIGDEVIVAFIYGDSVYPIILGSLYNKHNKSPNPLTDNNNDVKSITTKSGMLLSFDDNDKTVNIKTPGGNTITISDKDRGITIADQNSNSVELSSSGILLNSSNNIILKASGNITLQAVGTISVSSQQDVSLSGLNVINTAQMGFTAKGNATAELSASGETTVKGGIVMIN